MAIKKRRKNPRKPLSDKELANLKPFQKGDDPRRNIKGRPKKNIHELEEVIGIQFSIALTKADKYQIIESMLETPLDELKKIAENKECPAFMVNVATAIVADIQAGETTTMDRMLDRFFGKAKADSIIIKDDGTVAAVVNQESTLLILPSNGR